jgi:hypothetical protein
MKLTEHIMCAQLTHKKYIQNKKECIHNRYSIEYKHMVSPYSIYMDHFIVTHATTCAAYLSCDLLYPNIPVSMIAKRLKYANDFKTNFLQQNSSSTVHLLPNKIGQKKCSVNQPMHILSTNVFRLVYC